MHTDHSSVPAFWSDSEDCYVAYLRIRVDENLQPLTSHDGRSIRWIGRTTSDDFLNWSKVVPMNPGDVPLEQLYTNQTQPYFRAPHIYLAFPKRFNHNLVVLPEDEFDRYEVSAGQRQGVSEGVFMTSRGGTTFDRTFMEAFLPPGLEPSKLGCPQQHGCVRHHADPLPRRYPFTTCSITANRPPTSGAIPCEPMALSP